MSDLMILDTDVSHMLKDYETTIYGFLRDDDPQLPLLQESMKEGVLSHYGLSSSSIPEEKDALRLAKHTYLVSYVSNTYDTMIRECQRRLDNKGHVYDTMETLKSLKLPEQRSPEWYEMRNNVLTASSLADALGKGHFNTKESLLIDKTSTEKKPFVMNEIMEWGVRYEDVATKFYEKLHSLHVVEFGLVPHRQFPIFGASPDGICDIDSPPEYVGRMLEIKCPPRRQFTSDVPLHYWMQMQGQLETCDLEECDFLQVKLREYGSTEEYLQDTLLEEGSVKEGYAGNGFPKGLVLGFKQMIEGQPHYTYRYPPLCEAMVCLESWKTRIIDEYDEPYDECIDYWYRIDRYECTLVLRDRTWWTQTMPKIIDFWEDVEKYRREGNDALLKKRDARKQKRNITVKQKQKQKQASPTTVIHLNKSIEETLKNTYVLDSDSDAET